MNSDEVKLLPCPFCGVNITEQIRSYLGDDLFWCHPPNDCIIAGKRFAASIGDKWNTRPNTATPADDVVERVARAIKPALFREYPNGKSAAHEEARRCARAALAALPPAVGEKWEGSPYEYGVTWGPESEPTTAMIEAAASVAHERGCYGVTRPDLSAIISAALNASTQGEE